MRQPCDWQSKSNSSSQLFKEERRDEDLRAYLQSQQTMMQASIETIYAIARPPDDNYYQEVGQPQSKLLQGDAWERVRATVCQSRRKM